MKTVVLLLIISLMGPPVLAQTREVSSELNFLQEFDITFWQTLPFAFFWGSWLDKQLAIQQGLGGIGTRYEYVLSIAVGTALLNAYWHTKKVIGNR